MQNVKLSTEIVEDKLYSQQKRILHQLLCTEQKCYLEEVPIMYFVACLSLHKERSWTPCIGYVFLAIYRKSLRGWCGVVWCVQDGKQKGLLLSVELLPESLVTPWRPLKPSKFPEITHTSCDMGLKHNLSPQLGTTRSERSVTINTCGPDVVCVTTWDGFNFSN